MKNLARSLTISFLLLALLAPALARTRKGDDFLKQGRQAEVRKEYEKALELFEKAMLEDPEDAGYQIAAKRVRFQAAMARVDLGQKLRQEGKLEDALVEFQKAYAIDPASGIAEQEIRRTREMLEREKKGTATGVKPEDRGLTPGEQAEKEAEQRVARLLPIPELKPITPQISTLKMNNQPVRVLYETVGKLAGINVIIDPDYQPQGGKSTFTVDLSNTTLEQALDHLSVITKTFWKPLSVNTIFVTTDNVTKRRDYEDFVVKVFYIKNATTVQELQEIATTVRSIAEIRRAFTYNALMAIMVRDTADKVALAEKLINDLDKPKSEVVVDVIVMQANRSRVRDLSAALTTGGAAGIKLPILYTPGGPNAGTGTGRNSDRTDSRGTVTDPLTGGVIPTTTTTGTTNTNNGLVSLTGIKDIRLFGDFSTTVPGALLQAVMSDSQTRVLQQPQLRAVENQKASLRIGDRIPYASGSFTPAIGGVGAGFTPYAQTQFQFADVGVNVDLMPKVHGRDEISMHVEVEISNVSGNVEISGVQQPIISQRKVVHDIRIREGEVNLLGGLMSAEDINNVAGVPYLMQVPILKYLFGTDRREQRRGELLIALIPHVVRAPEFTDVNLRGVSAGSDATVKLNYAPRAIPAPPAGSQPSQPGPAQTQPLQQSPAASPASPESTPAPSPQQPQPQGEALPPTPPAPPEAQPSAAPTPRMTLSSVPAQAQLNTPFTVSLQLENMVDLFSASPLRLKFDPKVLQLQSINQGGLMGADGQRVTFTPTIVNEQGEAVIAINRVPGAGGISGSGVLVQLTFRPVARGTSPVAVSEVTVRNSKLEALPVELPSTTVTVQ